MKEPSDPKLDGFMRLEEVVEHMASGWRLGREHNEYFVTRTAGRVRHDTIKRQFCLNGEEKAMCANHEPPRPAVRLPGVQGGVRMSEPKRYRWVGGLAEWTEGNTAYLSVAFTWKLPEARQRAQWYRALGYHVRAGGPATFRPRGYMEGYAELGGEVADALVHHHPQATIASRGCPVGCWFCIVPAMEGRTFTLLPDFQVRPILCDNNLSALPADYQQHIVSRYRTSGVPLLDANSGFEPRTFDREVYERWKPINRGPWRFAYDDLAERPYVERVMAMLKDLPPKRKRVYVLIGNEPVDACYGRIREVIEWGGEPHCQPLMKLNAMTKEPWVRFDWTAQKLTDMARWANRRLWRYVPFCNYCAAMKTKRAQIPAEQWRLIA